MLGPLCIGVVIWDYYYYRRENCNFSHDFPPQLRTCDPLISKIKGIQAAIKKRKQKDGGRKALLIIHNLGMGAVWEIRSMAIVGKVIVEN